jgi:hypothetical protein
MPEIARRGRGTEERTPNSEIAPGTNIVKRARTARQRPHALSIPTPGQAGQGSMAPMETKTGRLSRTRTTIRARTRARRISGSLPAGGARRRSPWTRRGLPVSLRALDEDYSTIWKVASAWAGGPPFAARNVPSIV